MSEITIEQKQGMNVINVSHPELNGFEQIFYGNKNKSNAQKYGEWLDKLVRLQAEAVLLASK